MYRYSASHDIIYTAEDLILFKESPFASWMERLTLENPGHGIAPDKSVGDGPPWWLEHESADAGQRLQGAFSPLKWEDFVGGVEFEPPARPRGTLFTGAGSDDSDELVCINPALDESTRRANTICAMRAGAAFIANAQLAVGQLATTVDLLLRTPGASDLGDYLYLPVDLGRGGELHKAFCLAFAADLLHSLQGVLPPQLLVMRQDADMEAINTDQHIHYLQSVRQRFVKTQLAFRKHRMPDPGDSVHFGRWSNYASELMKRGASIEEAHQLINQPTAQDDEHAQEVAQAVQALVAQTAAAEMDTDTVPSHLAANHGMAEGAEISSQLITNDGHAAL